MERTRMLRRITVRAAQGRPLQSPIAGASWDARLACVIGSEPVSRIAIAKALGDFRGIDVECLDLGRRSIEVVSRRDFGLIIVDVRPGDPVALLGELGRRLGGASRRGVPVVVAHQSGDGERPAILSLVRQAGARRVEHPVDGPAVLALVDAMVALGPAGSTGRAAS